MGLAWGLVVTGCPQRGTLMGGKHHDPFATHGINGENAAGTARQEEGRGVLKDAGDRQSGYARAEEVPTSTSGRPLCRSSTRLILATGLISASSPALA
jgi:hypothetical protein